MLLSPPLVDQFYRTRHGRAATALVRERLSLLWPALRGMRVLGLGHARPYLSLWLAEAAAVVDAAAAPPVSGPWTEGGLARSLVVDEEALPFPDLAFDRILIVHGLEVAANTGRLLRECWRLLRDDGRLLVVTPNRVGLWAHLESTPFGQGEPFTQGQVARLLASAMFAVDRRDTALFLPPLDWGFVVRATGLADRVGRRVAPRFAGVHVTEAVKDMYAVIPGLPATGRLARRPALAGQRAAVS